MRRGPFRPLAGALALWAAGWWLPAAPAATAALSVRGSDRARLALPPGVSVEAYANANYSLRPAAAGEAEGEAVVEVAVYPLRARAPYRMPAGLAAAGDPVSRLAASLVAGSLRESDAADRILGWVAREVRYVGDRSAPQDALAVLARRDGYCTGIARATVALLRAAGLEAREVPGWVADAGAGRFHRWVEIRFSDRGWVFSDPLASHGFVAATYVRLAGEAVLGSDPQVAPGGLLLERDERLAAAGSSAARASVARNDEGADLASLHVSLPGARAFVLEGGGQWRAAPASAAGAKFLDLRPGLYRLRWQHPDGGWDTRPVKVEAGGALALHLARQAAASGRGVGSR